MPLHYLISARDSSPQLERVRPFPLQAATTERAPAGLDVPVTSSVLGFIVALSCGDPNDSI